MEIIDTILRYGLLTTFLLTSLILGSLYMQPRIWLQGLPQEVQISIPQKTKKEKKQTFVVMILFLLILLGFPVIAIVNSVQHPTLWQAWVISYSVYFIFNLTDLLFIDWLIVCTITPDFIKVKGVDEYVYKNYKKHFTDFLKGIVILIVPSFLSGLLGYITIKSGVY